MIKQEIRRNKSKRRYKPVQAHKFAEVRKKATPKYKAMTDKMIQINAKRYRKLLSQFGIQASMGDVSAC